MQTFNVANLNTQLWRFCYSNSTDFNKTFFINGKSSNNLTSSVGIGYQNLIITVNKSSNWIKDTIQNASYYYDSNENNELENGEQLGYKLNTTTDTSETVTISGISDNDKYYHYVLLALDDTQNGRTLYFNFYDIFGNNINSEMGYITDTNTRSVNCPISNGTSVYMAQLNKNNKLYSIKIQFQNFEYIYGSKNIAFCGIVATMNNYTTTNFPCFTGTTKVLTANNTWEKIKNLKRGDVLITNEKTNTTAKIANVLSYKVITKCFKIKSGLINNDEELICINHPIWCNNGKNRIFPSDIVGVEHINMYDTFYDIQFEDEGTFIISNKVLVDSLSPNHRYTKLPKHMYFNPIKYTDHIDDSEDDPFRNKPKMTKCAINFEY